MEDDNIIRELQEDIRRDRAKQLWDEYGAAIIGIAAAIVIGTGLGVGWKNYQANKNQQLTGMLLAATSQQDSGKRRAALEETVKTAGNRAQGALAKLYLAADARAESDGKAAFAIYHEMGETAKDEGLRNLGRVLAVHTEADSGPEAAEIKPVPPEGTFFLSWQEAEGWKYFATGKKDEARTRFMALASDVDAPPPLRTRMQAVASYLTPDKE